MKALFISEQGKEHFALPYLKHLPEFSKCLYTSEAEAIAAAFQHDLIWVEWASRANARIVNAITGKRKIIVRVHDHEIYRHHVNHFDWKKVWKIWFINEQAMEDFCQKLPTVPKSKMFYLPNAVDKTQFKEVLSSEKKIGLLSVSPRGRKKINRAIDLMRLLKHDDWTLHIRYDVTGYEAEHKALVKMAQGLPVVFETHQLKNISHKDDVNAFFADKAITLNTSEHEAFCYAIAEGALCGCMPSVLNWQWGKAKNFWGNYVVNTLEEMVQLVRGYEPSKEYRKYVVDRFDGKVLSKQLKAIIYE